MRANGRASGPVLQSVFLVILAHSASEKNHKFVSTHDVIFERVFLYEFPANGARDFLLAMLVQSVPFHIDFLTRVTTAWELAPTVHRRAKDPESGERR